MSASFRIFLFASEYPILIICCFLSSHSPWASDKKARLFGAGPEKHNMGFVTFGDPAILLRESSQLKTRGFASPVFTGFAFIGCPIRSQ
jgi:hypothetical protein